MAGEVYQSEQQDQLPPELLLSHFADELRQKLMLYFERRGMKDSDDLTHEVFVRLSKQLEQGVAIHNLTAYAFGVARIVHKEALRKSKETKLVSFSSLTPEDTSELHLVQAETINPINNLEREELNRQLELYLDELLPEDRELLIRYYSVDSKKALASEMGISEPNLRTRISRLRARLRWLLRRKSSRRNPGWRA